MPLFVIYNDLKTDITLKFYELGSDWSIKLIKAIKKDEQEAISVIREILESARRQGVEIGLSPCKDIIKPYNIPQ
jgi:hypothetical protein